MSDPIATYLLGRVTLAEKQMEKMHAECDAKVSILTTQIAEKNERIAELEKALADAKASAKAPVEDAAKASAEATKKPTNVSWADLADKNADGWQTVPKKSTRARTKVDAKAKAKMKAEDEIKQHGFTKGEIGEWNHYDTYSFCFIKPSNPSDTKGLNVYMKDLTVSFEEGATVYFKHEKGHIKEDGSPTRRCVTKPFYEEGFPTRWVPEVYSEEDLAKIIKAEGK